MNLKIGDFLHVLSLILEKTHLFVGDRPSSKERSEEKTLWRREHGSSTAYK